MSTGGIFQLITNDGKQDRMLMATELLSQRLADIKETRAGQPNPNPTLSDIEKTHVLFVNAHFKPFAAIAYEYNKVSVGTATLGGSIQFSIPQFGDFFNDMVLHVKLSVPTTSFTGTAADASDVTLFRYCDWPGERLLQKVSFDVNGNPLDDYYFETYNFHRQFCVAPGKMTGWMRNMGQEIPKVAQYEYDDTTGGTTAPLSAVACFDVKDGFQTYKAAHSDQLELFIPLLFWFNTDPRLSIPSVAIPYGQRFISVNLATKAQLLRAIVNPAATTALTNPVVSTPTVDKCDLYINNLFVNPDVHDIFIARVGFTLVRVHRRQVTNLNKASDMILLQSIKWPIETMFVGFRPDANVAVNTDVASTGDQTSVTDPAMEDWHKFGQVTTTNALAATINGASAGYLIKNEVNHVTKLTVVSHGIPLYNDIPAQFFNSYVPLTYGGYNIKTPEDPGCFMINFCLYPGTYQPSGHLNLSRARETHLEYTSTYVNSSNTADLVVVARAINFLLISDGSAVLRYST